MSPYLCNTHLCNNLVFDNLLFLNYWKLLPKSCIVFPKNKHNYNKLFSCVIMMRSRPARLLQLDTWIHVYVINFINVQFKTRHTATIALNQLFIHFHQHICFYYSIFVVFFSECHITTCNSTSNVQFLLSNILELYLQL